MGDGAFSVWKNLTSITIPNSVTSIEENAFCDYSSLNSIYVTKGDSDRVKGMLPEELHKFVKELE
ncbi:MAG: leucine-rich repeat protein [Bacteroidales bacterium]|nr:leucine-rich repeat protein [Bacteroidales bacterium]